MRTPRPVSAGPITAVLSVIVLALGGCGGAPSPNAWAASVCTALTPWRAEIGKLTSSTQQQMTAKTTPAQAKENLMRLLAGAEAASEKARREVEKAGVPDVTSGDRIASGFVASLSAVRDAYGNAKRGIEQLDASRAGSFYDGVESVLKTLTTEYNRSALDTDSLNSPELQRAFDEVPECR
ncbi:hypothetical protein SAMN05444365_11126 [Micromonospora pattaloongensis]|uniref:Lipoprotein n=1 Tax=Micromonospora pattaloongensis TaxID=405436 RepID=A0A1H3SBC0_9ACTN|nr:hypothetical protein [Micromonospora pattaloongensis]SDZ35403.1 hypothetical protein SAMN05444365_11126 [Micromonospora pattaloongensis]